MVCGKLPVIPIKAIENKTISAIPNFPSKYLSENKQRAPNPNNELIKLKINWYEAIKKHLKLGYLFMNILLALLKFLISGVKK